MDESAILAAIAARLTPILTPRERPRHRLLVEDAPVGYFDSARMRRLCEFDRAFVRVGDDLALREALDTPRARSEALDAVARALAAEGALTAWRDERYAVARAFDAPPVCHIERAAARYFGIHTCAAHANGLVNGARMWLARRSSTKAIDPGMLDNLVGGGIAMGETPDSTLVREAWEEAGIPAEIARRAVRCATLYVERAVPDGWQRETIVAYDLALPASFVPRNQDGEAVEHRCLDLRDVARLIAQASGRDAATVDASVVALDCLLRHHAIGRDARAAHALEALYRPR